MTHLKDQIEAAEKAARRIVERMGEDQGLSAAYTTPVGEANLIKFEKRFEAALKQGKVKLCPHLKSPQPIFVNLWAITMIRCLMCSTSEALEMQNTIEDMTCDNCRTVDPEGLHQVVMSKGMFTFVGGFCDDCYGAPKTNSESSR